jgi:hypothetical protein
MFQVQLHERGGQRAAAMVALLPAAMEPAGNG